MLIAIMSDTFSRHNDDLHANATRQKLVLQAEFVKLLNFYKNSMKCCPKKSLKNFKLDIEDNSTGYLFVIQPTNNGDDEAFGERKIDPSTNLILKVIE